MLKITIKNLDRLHSLVYELKIIAYLQQLTQAEGMEKTAYSATVYLNDYSKRKIEELCDLVFRDDFAESIKRLPHKTVKALHKESF